MTLQNWPNVLYHDEPPPPSFFCSPPSEPDSPLKPLDATDPVSRQLLFSPTRGPPLVGFKQWLTFERGSRPRVQSRDSVRCFHPFITRRRRWFCPREPRR